MADSDRLDSATTARESIYRNPSTDAIKPVKDGDVPSSSGQDSTSSSGRTSTVDSRRSVSHESKEEDGDGDVEEEGNGSMDMNALDRRLSRSHDVWKFHLRAADDDDPEDWWFASTAIPLLAATLGPLANVLSIAALVTSWRQKFDPSLPGNEDAATTVRDPDWCINLNITSLVLGFIGNLFLLCNFTRRIRYIIALPLTILFWFLATGILQGITISMNTYVPPEEPDQIYSQGFWYAVIAAVLYLACALLLLVNMLGYFLGHYTQHFDLSDDQRNLILQTMMFFIWLAGGAGVFSRICGWLYVDALYFCDVTILTVGFGDFYANTDLARGLVFPYSVGGTIILGLMVSSIRKFAQELGQDKVVKRHIETRRERTLERTVDSSFEVERRHDLEHAMNPKDSRPTISAPFDPQRRTIAFSHDVKSPQSFKSNPKSPKSPHTSGSHVSWSLKSPLSPLRSPISWASSISEKHGLQRGRSLSSGLHKLRRMTSHRSKLLVLREEKDRFDAMRQIQYSTRLFKRYFALTMSVIAFGLLWCVGAVVIWQAEIETQGMTYFQALYFCYVSLLTIGYGDLSPKSNAGKPFFVVWSLLAVPTMTILISDMGDTVIESYKRGTFSLANWTLLPKKGVLHEFLLQHPKIAKWVNEKTQDRAERRRIEQGFPTGPEPDPSAGGDENGGSRNPTQPTLEELANEGALDEHELARRLTHAIRRTADDLKNAKHRRYSYEEWVEYTRLIRFSTFGDDGGSDAAADLDREEAEEGIVKWDWIGEDSPMMADQTECEWVLDRLCESLDRYMRRQLPESARRRRRRSRTPHRSEGGTSRRRRSVSVNQSAAPEPERQEPAPSWLGAPRGSDAGRNMQSIAAMRMKQK